MDIVLPAWGAALIALDIGLVAIAKPAFEKPWAPPVLSLVFGVLLAFLIPGIEWRQVILDGLIIGLSASGLYSQYKTVVA